MNTWYRRALVATAAASLLATVSGCGHSTTAAGPTADVVSQQPTPSVPEQAAAATADPDPTDLQLAGNGKVWTPHATCESNEQMDAQLGQQWVDPSSTMLGPRDGKVAYLDVAPCEYASSATDGEGMRQIMLEHSANPHESTGPGVVATPHLGQGAFAEYVQTSDQAHVLQSQCTLLVPMQATGPAGVQHVYAVTVDIRGGDHPAEQLCQEALVVLRANADQNGPTTWTADSQSTPTVSPVAPDAGMPAVTPAQCANATTLNDQQAEACFMAKYPIQIPGWTPSQAGCPDDNSLTRPQYFACRQAGDILIP